jgi:hypothetical protein
MKKPPLYLVCVIISVKKNMFLFDYLKKITMKTIKQKLKQNPPKKPGCCFSLGTENKK